MAIVVYKCSVCKREIEKPRNNEGLERVLRCTITQGCRGKLYQSNLFPDYIRGSLPDDVTGLNNWVQRKVLHNHEQPLEKDQWTIIHNLGVAPAVTVLVDRPIEGNEDNREEIIPTDIVYQNDNVVVLVFDRAYSGIAQLIARQSDPDLLRPPERAVVETAVESIQISNNSVITVATLATATEIDLDVQYTTTTGTDPLITYTVDDQPSLNSPWVDFDRVIVKGKIYTVRSFNALVPEMTSGIINNGANFRITDVSDGSSPTGLAAGEVLILLASSPFDTVDKIRNQFIDASTVTSTENQFGLFYDAGDFFADVSIIDDVFPLIRSI